MPRLLSRIAVDVTPLRESRDLRLLVLGNFVSGMGTQAALVALPYQIYVETRSAFLTGLLGAAELLPLVAMALLGGALADRHDRRLLLLADQLGLVACSALLALLAFLGDPPVALLFVLGAALAGFGAVQNVARSAIVPNLVDPSRPRLGDVEAGTVASLASPRFSVVSGGLACVAGSGSSSWRSRRCCATTPSTRWRPRRPRPDGAGGDARPWLGGMRAARRRPMVETPRA